MDLDDWKATAVKLPFVLVLPFRPPGGIQLLDRRSRSKADRPLRPQIRHRDHLPVESVSDRFQSGVKPRCRATGRGSEDRSDRRQLGRAAGRDLGGTDGEAPGRSCTALGVRAFRRRNLASCAAWVSWTASLTASLTDCFRSWCIMVIVWAVTRPGPCADLAARPLTILPRYRIGRPRPRPLET